VESYFAERPGRARLNKMLREAGVQHTDDPMSDWDLFLPTDTGEYLREVASVLPSRVDQWIGAIPDSYWMSNKANLWELLRQAGPEAAALMPESWLVRRPAELADLQSRWRPGDRLILKDPTRQRREGLRLCDNLSQVPVAADEGFFVAQRLAEDLLLIGGRRFHLRAWIVIIHQAERFWFWVYRDGRLIYAPAPATEDGVGAWLTRSVGSHALPAGFPFLLSELAPPMEPIMALLQEVARLLLPRLRQAWSLGWNPAVQLFGADLLLREGGGAYILECNRGPDMTAKCRRDEALKRSVIADLISALGADAGGSWPGGFELILKARDR
jgi:hypothetical protein